MSNSIMGMGSEITIKEYNATYDSEEIVSSAFFLKQVFSSDNNRKMIVNFNNLITKYMPELKDSKIKVKINEKIKTTTI